MTMNKSFDTIENDGFVLSGRLSADQRFADGVTQLFFGFPITKVLFHTVVEPRGESNPEIRKAEQYLTIPTIVAIELANYILSMAKQSEQQLLDDSTEDVGQKMSSILSRFQIGDMPGVAIEQIAPKKRPPKKTV